jgi:hypothetical protein
MNWQSTFTLFLFACVMFVGFRVEASESFPTLEDPMQFIPAHTGGNCTGCAWVSAQGVITEDTPSLFKSFLESGRSVQQIVFHSPGGSLTAGIELARLIREAGLSTSIGETRALEGDLSHLAETRPGVCASACAFAFIGGVDRSVGVKDLLGVHQFYTIDPNGITSSETQRLVGLTLLHAMEMDVDASMIVAASAANQDQIYWFSQAELRSFRIDNSSVQIDSWWLEPYRNGLVLSMRRREGANREVAMTLFCRSDQRWRLLISEELAYAAIQLADRRLYRFDDNNRPEPKLTIGEKVYMIGESAIENFRVDGNWLYLTLILPESIQDASGAELRFDPDLPRYLSSLFSTQAILPESGWLKATKRNCI